MCSFVATAAEFRREGCPNCDDRLEVSSSLSSSLNGGWRSRADGESCPLNQMKGDTERVLMCTTGQFDGTIALINPEESWVVSISLSHSPESIANELTSALTNR